jgi:hypothetical protein
MRILAAILALASLAVGQQRTFPALETNNVWQGTNDFPDLNGIRNAKGFSGENAGAKIAAAIANLPSTGGTVDARGIEGGAISQDLFAGVTKPVTLLLGHGTYTFSVTQSIGVRGVVIRGAGADAGVSGGKGTYLRYTGTGEFFKIGTDNGLSYELASYDGIQGQSFEDLRIEYTGTSTSNLNNGDGVYGTGTYGIRDWRGGHIVLRNVTVRNFEYGFWGLASDINRFDTLLFAYNKVGIYLGPRSDQATIQHYYTNSNDTAVHIDGAKHARFLNAQFVGDGSLTDYPIKIGSAWAEPARGNTFVDCWFEEYDPNSLKTFVGVGIGDSLQSIDTRFIRPLIVANTAYIEGFITIENGDYVEVDEPALYRGNPAPFSVAFFKFIGATSPANIQFNQFSANDTSYTVMNNGGIGSPVVSIVRRLTREFGLDYAADASGSQAISFRDRGTLRFQLLRSAGGTFQLWDSTANLGMVGGSNNGSLNINSQGGNAVEINKATNSGSGGLEVWGGGASPALKLKIPSTFQKAITGTRFVCVDTNGNLVSQTTACSGT